MKVLTTDVEYPDIELEHSILESAGVGVELVQCCTPKEKAPPEGRAFAYSSSARGPSGEFKEGPRSLIGYLGYLDFLVLSL